MFYRHCTFSDARRFMCASRGGACDELFYCAHRSWAVVQVRMFLFACASETPDLCRCSPFPPFHPPLLPKGHPDRDNMFHARLSSRPRRTQALNQGPAARIPLPEPRSARDQPRLCASMGTWVSGRCLVDAVRFQGVEVSGWGTSRPRRRCVGFANGCRLIGWSSNGQVISMQVIAGRLWHMAKGH